MKARLLLARYAEVQNAMLYASGAGITEIGPDPSPFAIALLIEVPWDETSRRHELKVDIVDADGQPLVVPTPTGEQAFHIVAHFDVGRPPGSVQGRSFMVPVAMNLTPLPFRPGQGYVVRASIDDKVVDETPILTRPSPPPQHPR